MDIIIKKENDFIEARVSGEFTVADILTAKEKLAELINENADIKLDISNVGEFDSSALQLLSAFSKYAGEKGINVKIVSNSSKTELFLKTYGMEI